MSLGVWVRFEQAPRVTLFVTLTFNRGTQNLQSRGMEGTMVALSTFVYPPILACSKAFSVI